MSEISTKPYLLRAIYEWCTDNGYTPYIAAAVDAQTRVPREFVKNGEIVLNISFTATSSLKMGNDSVDFHARFGGVSREISIPVQNVVAIYARENGQGMAFEASTVAPQEEEAATEDPAKAPALSAVPPADSDTVEKGDGPDESGEPPGGEPSGGAPPKKGGRPTLTRIK
jgi:stringent starvation protein B